jgi:hypothetical protein
MLDTKYTRSLVKSVNEVLCLPKKPELVAKILAINFFGVTLAWFALEYSKVLRIKPPLLDS